MPELTPVQEYYKGKTVFITGASGFMGKVLVEKLLYSCSALKEVIIIVRPKRGKSPEVRLEEMFKLPIFQRIREEKPEVLKKVTSFNGDVTYENLGLSGENLKYVTDNTNIVFHMAATLKLEGNLKDAIDMNTTGTRRALDIAKQMKGLEAFVHVSTAFCNCDQEVMHEKIYEYPHKPEDLMRMVEWMDVKTLDSITPELLKPHPNTYTYSKRLAEILVRDHYETMPVIIARPSIVSPSAYEPVPGWVDNLNGPTGLLVGAGKGVIRSMLIDTRFKSEVIPVDYAINGLIVMPYDFNKQATRPATVPIFNITAAEHRKLQWGEAIEMGKKIGYEYPMELCLWYPDGCITTNRFHHQINVILFHWLPAYLIDFLLLILGQKRFMLRVQRRIQIGLEVLQFFSMRSWVFKSTAFDGLWKSLTPEDKKIFNMDMDPKESIQEYMLSCLHGGRLYLMKETPESLPRARRNLKILYVLDRFCKTVILGLLAYWLYNRIASFISVSPAAFEPQKGWVDNLNGPTGLMIGVGKGVIRSVLVDENNRSEVIPVDYAINGLIVMPYEFYKSRRRPAEVPVYNITNADHRKTKMGDVIVMCKRLGREYPLNVGLWYPDAVITTNKLYHQFNVLMFHWLPAYFLDFLLLIFGQKRFMVRVQNKISTGLDVLQFFTLHPWYFKSDNFASLWQNLSAEDKAIFNMDMNSDHTEEEYVISCIKGGREYILKEKNEDLTKARFHQKIMYGIDRLCKTVIVGLFVYYLLKWTGVLALFSVTPAVQEPLPGWVDNLNGPTGVMIGAGKGVIRSMLCNGELRSEIIPVDMAINGFILLPYRFNTMEKRPQNIPIFNLTVPDAKKRTWKWVMDVGRDLGLKYPFEIGLWYPDGNLTTNKLYHWFCVVMFMWLPAYIVDLLLTIFRQRRFMVRVQTRIAIGLEVLQFFTTRCWNFKSQNFEKIQEILSARDKIIFKIEMNDVDDYEYLRTCILGGRQYVLKEPLSSLPRSRTQLKFLYILDRFCKFVILAGLLYWICSKFGVLEYLHATTMKNIK